MSMTSRHPAPRLEPEQLAEMRRRLEEARADHQERITVGAEAADDITLSIAARREAALAEVEAALLALEAGEYGMCSSCGEPIHPERLEALPHARLCAGCASRLVK